MRVLILGRSKHRIAADAGLYRALKRMGHAARLIDDRKLRQHVGAGTGSRLIYLATRVFRPERMICLKPHDVTEEVITAITRSVPSTMWYRDLTVPPDPKSVSRARYMETVFLTAGGQASEWEAQGIRRVLWLPNAADRDLDKPMQPDPRYACDVAFIGRGYDVYRAEFLVRLARRFHVRVWGQDWHRWARELNWDGTTAYGRDFARVCASAKIMIDINPSFWITTQVGAYSSNRMVKVLACNGFCLSHLAPGLDQLFREGEHCAWFRDENDAFAKIEQYLTDDAARHRARAGGHNLVWQHHMLDNRVHNLLTGEPYVNPLSAS